MARPFAGRARLAQLLLESVQAPSGEEEMRDALDQELRVGAAAPLTDYIAFDVEAFIRLAKQRHFAYI